MPSSKNPNQSVNPGSGRLPASSVPASALLFVSGGGGGGVNAHIANPIDAHMATAIGLPPVYPAGTPLLSSAGGPFDGENVADAISQLSALLPSKPDAIGFNNPVVNSGIPTWANVNSPLVGGFSSGSNIVFTKYLVSLATATFTLTGMAFPADRGVLALYKTATDATFATGATLVAALNLGALPIGGVPPGNPSFLFNEANRLTLQPDYAAPGTTIDLISLTKRFPYKSSYASPPYNVGGTYTGFTPAPDFPAYQLATYAITPQALSAGNAGSFILVHWKETYATTLASIQPGNLAANLSTTNCYSAVPSGGNYDGTNVLNVNRRNVFRDAGAPVPGVSSFTSTLNPLTPGTTPLSGVAFITNATNDVSWDINIQATNLFNDSYLTGTAANVNIPSSYESANNPVDLIFTDFGGGTILVPYYDIRKLSTPPNYAPGVAPAISDTAEIIKTSQVIPIASPFTPVTGIGSLRAQVRDPFGAPAQYQHTGQRYLFNSYTQSSDIAGQVTSTLDSFVSERYRYLETSDAMEGGVGGLGIAASPLVPSGVGNAFPSATVFVANNFKLQVVGGQIVYPQTNFSAAAIRPASQPDYSAVLSADAANHIRRYVRAFDTGTSRSTGKIRLRSLAAAAFTSTVGFTNEVANHPGGAVVQLKVPDLTGWLDLGRAFGSFDGCAAGAPVIAGPDVTVAFNTGSSTGNNGSGQFLIFIRISYIKGPGTALVCDEVEWLPP